MAAAIAVDMPAEREPLAETAEDVPLHLQEAAADSMAAGAVSAVAVVEASTAAVVADSMVVAAADSTGVVVEASTVVAEATAVAVTGKTTCCSQEKALLLRQRGLFCWSVFQQMHGERRRRKAAG